MKLQRCFVAPGLALFALLAACGDDDKPNGGSPSNDAGSPCCDAIVAGALDGALPPSEWEHRRNLITGLSAGLDLDELDESYTPGTTSAPAPERSSLQSLRPPGPRAPDR